MATLITGKTGQDVYPEVIQRVLAHGQWRRPRGKQTRDLGFTVIELESPRYALPLGTGRKLNRNIAAAEAAQLIGAFSDPLLLTRASENFERYTNNGRFHGAYGERIHQQVMCMLRKLHGDSESRQAVATLWDPWLDNLPGKNDYPCTIALQFEHGDGVLDMNVIMRSNDVWLGLPYDMFQFTQLQLSVCNSLGMTPGVYRHTALSLHIYTENVEAAGCVHKPLTDDFQPDGIGRRNEFWHAVVQRAKTVPYRTVTDPTESEEWYRERFASYMG